jgi:hypothetical protein
MTKAMAGPFEAKDFEKLIPSDKKLSREWIRSLYERGVSSVCRGDALRHIGMPVNGICTGQLYLGGDGALWHWDIFKSKYSRIYGKDDFLWSRDLPLNVNRVAAPRRES